VTLISLPRRSADSHDEPVVLPLAPTDAATVAAGSPATSVTVDGQRVLVLPARDLITEDTDTMVLVLSRADALRVAAGQPVVAASMDGQEVLVRPATADDVIAAYHRAATESGHPHAVPPPARETAEQLIRPLDLAELSSFLIDGGPHGTTYVDRIAQLLRLAGHHPTTTPVNSPHESALDSALMSLEQGLAKAVEALKAQLAEDDPGPGYADLGHFMLADLQQAQRLVRHVATDFGRIVRFRAPRP
jgi:hypothetical protein